jgi:hypothetical protein
MAKVTKIRWSITLLCIALLIGHQFWPGLKLDLPSTILIVVAILPWLAPVIKSVELPGGFKIELQEIKAATEKVLAEAELPTAKLQQWL